MPFSHREAALDTDAGQGGKEAEDSVLHLHQIAHVAATRLAWTPAK